MYCVYVPVGRCKHNKIAPKIFRPGGRGHTPFINQTRAVIFKNPKSLLDHVRFLLSVRIVLL